MSCTCRNHSIIFAPSSDTKTTRGRLVSFYAAGESVETAENRAAEVIADLARHEAGHAAMGAAFGRGVRYLTLGAGNPHCAFAPAESLSLFVSIACALAGPAAQAIGRGDVWSISNSMMAKYLAWTRDSEAGTCDMCAVACDLVENFADRSDDELLATWAGFNHIVASILSDDDVTGAILTLAALLRERTLLHADEIESVMNRYDLAGAPDRALAGVDLKLLLPIW